MMIPALYLFCTSCRMPSIAIVSNAASNFRELALAEGEQAINPFVAAFVAQYPDKLPLKAPEHIPKEVERVYLQAVDAHRRTNLDLAAMGFRRALELALKAKAPDLKGQLGPRIDQLAAKHVLTPAMKEWAEDSRVLGNEANHDPPEPTPENVQQLFLFTESLLEYLFTLPEKVRQRREAKKPKS